MTDFATINAGHRAFMRDQRKWAKENAAKLQAEWDALPDVPRTIEAHRPYQIAVRDELKKRLTAKARGQLS